MATRIDVRTDFVRQEAAQFIRASTITITLKSARPNARMNVFFDDENVNVYCGLDGETIGTPIVTDANGAAVIKFQLPAGKFNPGTKTVFVTDAQQINQALVNGSRFGWAENYYLASGTVQFFQTTQNTEHIVEVLAPPPPPPPPVPAVSDDFGGNDSGDPLAQSFFTYGYPDGLFVSSIELYFNSKDTQGIPVQVELRGMENGRPARIAPRNPNLISVLSPNDVSISADGSAATKFKFEPPVYLRGDSDYAFVVFSNSREYQLFCSRLGEDDLISGKKIWEQPHIGSLFRSENNITWSADQFEDIKFKLNRAKFTSSGSVDFDLDHAHYKINGNSISTTNGSPELLFTLGVEHGLEVGQRVAITNDQLGTFNGIPADKLHGEFIVISTPTRKSFSVNCTGPSTATSTGPVLTSGVVRSVEIDDGGSNYDSNTTVTFTGGGGTNAAGTVTVVNGVITGVTMTDVGSGYTSSPTMTFSGGAGSGASAYAFVDTAVNLSTNAPYQSISSNISYVTYGKSSVQADLYTTLLNYDGGTINSYAAGNTYNFNLEGRTDLHQNSVVMSQVNQRFNPSAISARVGMSLLTDTDYNSPVIDIRGSQGAKHYNFIINNDATNETLAAGGNAKSKYITKVMNIEFPSNGIRVWADIGSSGDSSVDWYVRGTLSGSGVDLQDKDWTLMNCDRDRNLSSSQLESVEYEFYLNNMDEYDAFQLKAVLLSADPTKAPKVYGYRAVTVL